jgi:cytochrome b561
VRLRNPPPPLPADLPAIQKLAAHASHWLLYLLMLVIPLVGWAMLSAGGYPVMLSDSLRLPPIFPVSPVAFAVLRHTHAWLAMLLFLTFLAHLGAALYHGLIRRDGVLSSMTGYRPK